MTLCLAIITHAIIILGITFTAEDKIKPRYNTMEIILVQQKSRETPDNAELMAQANLVGGGNSMQEISPSTPLPPPFPDNQAEVAAASPAEFSPPEQVTKSQEQSSQTMQTETRPVDKIVVNAKVAETTPVKPEHPEQTAEQEKKTKPIEKPAPPKKPRPSATALLTNSFKIAALSAEIKRKLEAKAQRPIRKFISASTREYKYAAYMEAWRAKVERVGNLNYPEEARKRRLSGSLILDVALNPDGTVNQITIRHSSGYKILDDAAIRIVELASPFSPFPDNIRHETDILHITRTWQFLNNRGFR